LDKLIHYVNKDGRLNVFYSTPIEVGREGGRRGGGKEKEGESNDQDIMHVTV